MKNRKGQALVEFIIICPIIIMLLTSIIDFGIYFNKKNELESSLEEVVNIYKKTNSLEEVNKYLSKTNKGIKLNYTTSEEFYTIKLSEEYKFQTPGLNLVFKNKDIDVERVVYNE